MPQQYKLVQDDVAFLRRLAINNNSLIPWRSSTFFVKSFHGKKCVVIFGGRKNNKRGVSR